MANIPILPNISSQIGSTKQSTPPPVRAEKEGDKNKDVGASTKINAPAPAVNASGHAIGANIDITA